MKNVFLGGTCNGSLWREALIALLDKATVSAFNPVVANWTPECQAEEIKQRETCDVCLYVITPKMTGVYSIAEVVDDSNKRPAKTVFCFLETDDGATFEKHQMKALAATGKMVAANGGKWLGNLKEVADYLNA
jgi:hypothetical protein